MSGFIESLGEAKMKGGEKEEEEEGKAQGKK